jgi:hypothetical protein
MNKDLAEGLFLLLVFIVGSIFVFGFIIAIAFEAINEQDKDENQNKSVQNKK